MNMLEKVFIFQLEQAFWEKPKREMTLSEFVMAFLDFVKHEKEEEIFITAGLIDIFNDITHINGTFKLKWEDFTSFMIENVVESDMEDFIIPSNYISKMTSTKYDNIYNSIELTKHIPMVMGGSELCLRRFSPSTKLMDSMHHNQGIKRIVYLPESKQIACLDNLTEDIKIYDDKWNMLKKLGPSK